MNGDLIGHIHSVLNQLTQPRRCAINASAQPDRFAFALNDLVLQYLEVTTPTFSGQQSCQATARCHSQTTAAVDVHTLLSGGDQRDVAQFWLGLSTGAQN